MIPKKQNHVKKIAGRLHLWLGLGCGLVVLVSMSAATVFVWNKELTNLFYGETLQVKQTSQEVMPLSVMLEEATRILPGKRVSGIEIINSPTDAYAFTTYKACPTCEGWSQWSEVEYWQVAFVNPYTGKATGVIDMMQNWIELCRRIHQNLLLRYSIGHYIVGISTLIVLAMVVTGIVLWFPKNKAAIKQRFTIKFSARWRRVNYDIHNVGGFYAWILIAFFATTGLAWTFEWWENGIYKILGSTPENVTEVHQPLKVKGSLAETALDNVAAQLPALRPTWTNAYISLPPLDGDTISDIDVYLTFNTHNGWEEMDEYHFHPVTGKVTFSILHEKKTLAAKWRNSNYSLHVGSIYGLPSKIVASLTALFLASLPVTGFMIWMGRKNKKKSTQTAQISKPSQQSTSKNKLR